MELAIISKSWRHVQAITEIVEKLDQTREDARALKYLETQAKTFLTMVTDGLAGVDPKPYRETIVSLELLYEDILATSEKYIADGKIKQIRKATETRRNILRLNQRMKMFFDTYLLHATTGTAHLNLQALVELPPPLPHMSITSEKAMWKIMSWSHGTNIGNRTSSNPSRAVSDPACLMSVPPHETSISPMTQFDNLNSSYAGSVSQSRPSTPPSPTLPSPSLPLPPAYATLPPFLDSYTPSHRNSTDRITQRIAEYSSTRSDKTLSVHQLEAHSSPTANHDPVHIRKPDPSMSPNTPRASHPVTFASAAPCPSGSTSRIPASSNTEYAHSEGNEETHTPHLRTPRSTSDSSFSTQPGGIDTGLRIANGLSQNLPVPPHSSSRPRRPLPPTPASERTTPRQQGFDLRLQALRDSTCIGHSNGGWLFFKKDEILYTDGKKFNIQDSQTKSSHTVVMAQNSDGNCGFVDPGNTFSEGFFSKSRPYLRYLG